MLYTMKYPMELRLEVVKAYQNHVGGYKKLAKQYGLNRDLVRYWILDRKRKQPLPIDELIQVMEGITMAESGKAPTVTKEIEELRLQLAYYKKLSEILEAESKDVKKSALPSDSITRIRRTSSEAAMCNRRPTTEYLLLQTTAEASGRE